MGEMDDAYKILVGKRESEELGVDGRMIE